MASRYGRKHRATRAGYVAAIVAGQALICWRCVAEGRRGPDILITSVDDLHVGHDDDDPTVTRGPEHRLCNLRAAAAKTNRTRPRPRSREW